MARILERAALSSICAATMVVSTLAEVTYCDTGTSREHSHFSSHDIPSADGVIVKARCLDGFTCQTNDHPLVRWTKSFPEASVSYSIDIVPVEKERADRYLNWIKAQEISGGDTLVETGEGWKETDRCVFNLGGVKAVAVDFACEDKKVWRRYFAIPAQYGKLVVVDFSVQAEDIESAESFGEKILPSVFEGFTLANPLGQRGLKVAYTGWFVTPSNVVTCAHCTEAPYRNWFKNAAGKKVELKLIAHDTDRDIALLTLVDPADANAVVLPVAAHSPRLAEQVWTLGYPMTEFLGDAVKYGEGVVSSRVGRSGNQDQFMMTAPIRPGASGGPVFNSAGCVCGLMNAAPKAQDMIAAEGYVSPESNWVVKAEPLYAFLKENGVPFHAQPLLPAARPDAVEQAATAVVYIHSEAK